MADLDGRANALAHLEGASEGRIRAAIFRSPFAARA